MRPLNILYISHERKMGGANFSLYELVKEMKNKGHRVRVAVLYRGCPIDLKLREEGIETVPCFFGWWQEPENLTGIFKYGLRVLHALEVFSEKKLIKYVKDNKIDIIHSNSSCVDIGMRVAYATKRKHVWHFREYGKADYNLIYMKGRKESIDLVNKYSDAVIFISKALRNAYSDIDDVNKVKVIYNGISEKYIGEPKKYHERPVFLVSGNLSENKNQLLVLKAVKILQEKGIVDFEVKIAGESSSLKQSKEYKDILLQYIKENNLDNVQMMGYVHDMKALRRETDVEIVASVSEAFGRVTVEAMFSYNPVIVSDAGANPELVEKGKTGLIFQNMDANALAEEMERLIKCPDLISEMGKKAHDYAIENFTIQKNAENIEELYDQLIS